MKKSKQKQNKILADNKHDKFHVHNRNRIDKGFSNKKKIH